MALGWRGSYLRYREFFLNVMELYKKRADLRAFLEISLSIGTITIFLLFALKPTAVTIIDLIQEIQAKQKTLAGLNQKVNDLQTASVVFGQNQNTIPDVDSAIPTQPDPDVLSKQVQGLVAKDSVNLLGLSIGEVTLVGQETGAKQPSDYKPISSDTKEMSISISVKGDYASLLNFIKDFENMRVISKIDILGINSSQTQAGQVIVALISARAPFLQTK